MIEELRKLESQGLITLRAHDELPLFIANYTPEVQYGRLWDEHELIKQCRGLIVDEDGNVIARPFPKFFNIEEHQEFDSLPDIPYGEHHLIYNKLDGSLGIIYWYAGEWRVATRGSFHSEQADKARELLTKYETKKMDKDFTYLVEIIYPENRIVVDYGGKEELIMIAKIRTIDGAEPMELSELHESNVFPIVQKEVFTIESLEKSREDGKLDYNGEDKEGYVIHFQSGLRVKIKLDEYVRLHRLMTGLTKRKIWELLRDGENIDELYKTAPDEVYQWVEQTADELVNRFNDISLAAKIVFMGIICNVHINSDEKLSESERRKLFAMEVKKSEKAKNNGFQGVLFKMYDNKNPEDLIWKMIKPEHEPINTHKETNE